MVSKQLKKERKKVLVQVLILGVCCLLLSAGGVFFSRGHFTALLEVNGWSYAGDPHDITLKWTEGEMPGTSVSVIKENVLRIVFVPPKEQGTYTYELYDGEGEFFYTETLYILPGNIVYSLQTKNFSGCIFTFVGITLFFIGAATLCGLQYFRFRGPLMYSYDAMFTCGIAIFSTVTSLNLLIMLLEIFIRPERYLWMSRVYSTLGLSGGWFLLVSALLILVFSALMIISNIELLRHERFRVQNVLGLTAGVLMFLVEVVGLLTMSRDFSGSETELRRFYIINSVVLTVITYFECILFSSVICGLRAAKHVPETDRDYILILGCAFRQDGSLTPLLKGRVDKAVEFWKRQKEKSGKQAVLVPSGGQGKKESMAEAEAMARYLRSLEIPEDAILLEDQSRNTYQNMEFSRKKILEREGIPEDADSFLPKVAYVTTNYHVFRSGVWAGLADLAAEGLGSKTKWWFWPNAFIRECVGLLKNRMLFEILFLILAVIFFGLFSMQIV